MINKKKDYPLEGIMGCWYYHSANNFGAVKG